MFNDSYVKNYILMINTTNEYGKIFEYKLCSRIMFWILCLFNEMQKILFEQNIDQLLNYSKIR